MLACAMSEADLPMDQSDEYFLSRASLLRTVSDVLPSPSTSSSPSVESGTLSSDEEGLGRFEASAKAALGNFLNPSRRRRRRFAISVGVGALALIAVSTTVRRHGDSTAVASIAAGERFLGLESTLAEVLHAAADEAAKGPSATASWPNDVAVAGDYVTNAGATRAFEFGEPARTPRQAFDDAFPDGAAWETPVFEESPGADLSPEALIAWVDKDLLEDSEPFKGWGKNSVPIPFSSPGYAHSQLAPGQFVGYSRRQLCYIVAKSLVGAPTKGFNNGLLRFMNQKVDGTSIFDPAQAGQYPRKAGFGQAWWQMLAVCAADPALKNGGQGSLVVMAVHGPEDPSVGDAHDAAFMTLLSSADLRVCRYDDGSDGALPPGLKPVPAEGCQQPTATGPGRDFMTGDMKGQAIVDITAGWLGGYINTNAAGIGGGQDERLMTYMPEVLTMGFFLSQDPSQWPQVRAPAWVLGARMISKNLDGTCRFNVPVVLNEKLALTSDIEPVRIGQKLYHMSSSTPFLGFYSKSQDWGGDPFLNRMNRDPGQREVLPEVWYSFSQQVQAYYAAAEVSNYAPQVQGALTQLVRSLGTGPWGAGLWFGDSQVAFLATWIGHAIAARSWAERGGSLSLDYYIYSAFTENPSNQCLVHKGSACEACLKRCADNPLPESAFWLPDGYFMHKDDPSNSCIPSVPGLCGRKGVEDVVQVFAGQTAAALWMTLDAGLRKHTGNTNTTVFDILLGA